MSSNPPPEDLIAQQRQRFLRNAADYQPHIAADLIVLFAMSVPYRLMPHLGLRLRAPEAFRAACHRASGQVQDAHFDAGVHGWVYDGGSLVGAFADQGIPALAPEDMDRFNRWLEDGYGLNTAAFHRRLTWRAALRWILLKPEPVRILPPAVYDDARAFAESWHSALQSAAWEAALSDVQETPGDDLDALLQTKFHLVILDDDLEDEEEPFGHSPLSWLEDVRAGGVLRRQIARLRTGPARLGAVEELVVAYLQHGPVTARTAALREDPGRLRAAGLFDWSRPDADN